MHRPVRGNKCHFTNLNWVIDGDEMSRELNIPHVQIVNDFVGLGYGLLALTREDLVPINDVAPNETGPKAVLGAGTGLGEAYLTYNGAEYDVLGCEGGHTDFAARTQQEFDLMEFIKQEDRVERVSVERAVSGMGIPRIFDFFAKQFPEEVSKKVTERMAMGEDKGAVIAESARDGSCPVSVRAIDTFVQLYGAEGGNLALKTLPFGGLYVAGM
jgi:glucokinase